MIKFINLSDETPYQKFKEFYHEALNKNQSCIEAVAISSFNSEADEVDSRFVNLKYIAKDEWIFFSNYNSVKSRQFELHPQISAMFYWKEIDTQIRIKAKIFKTSKEFSNEHFASRSLEKNALAISSAQSKPIKSFNDIKTKYLSVLNNKEKLQKRPSYWGGYSFKPYSFEFWKGNEFRLNKRSLYKKNNDNWDYYLLEP
tara:strand:- start:509 stop:1108 length:600 start_codon:yes stop_codon:yes gene_type:complete